MLNVCLFILCKCITLINVSDLVICMFLMFLNIAGGPSQEYCQWEKFHAECASDEVVIMERATYGRMQLGRCVDKDLGYLG